jgi:Cytochrome c3
LKKYLISCLIAFAAIMLITVGAAAQEDGPQPPSPGVSNDTCLACHDTPGLQMELPSGEPLYLTVDSVVYDTSTHGRLGYACVQCHTNITGYPHPEVTAETRREFSLQLYTACKRCHLDKYEASLDSVHQVALAGGNLEAAVCTDCHGAHDVGPPDVPRSKIPHTCERCHSEIYNEYQESVHGEALIGEGNPDVPTCIDCHGVHNVEGPTTGPFRLFSPTICLECHSDPQLMDKYGLNTNVGETYLSDFHGTTVMLFEKVSPDQETNKPVCIDCHGVHNIKKTDDPESTVIKENLLVTCQKCHPDATTNFPAAWLGHYVASVENSPLVYFVNLFYKIFIPTVLGIMGIYVASDVFRRAKERRAEKKHE